ncbi:MULTISPECIES: conjugal transfer protein TraN [unclassified Candidatus Tisiphia]|uniref:conjugal transfer protein TraN n=1 Tax=unclassified Candidatus Tisiphia TaxID=2996318 RepID=UPI00312C83BF
MIISTIHKIIKISLLLGCSNIAVASNMQQAFEQRDVYRDKVQLGNPADGNKVFFDKDADVSSLSNLSDQDLTSKGRRELSSSENSKLLQTSEEAKINAMQEHKINSENPMLKNSLKIESDPFKETGGDNYVSSESTFKVKINKSCLEGVDFEVDVVKQLVFESEYIDQWGEWHDRSLEIGLKDINLDWTEMASKEYYYDKDNWWRTEYRKIREEDPFVQVQLKAKVAEILSLDKEQIGNSITVGYREEKTSKLIFYIISLPKISTLHYKYREKFKQFKEKGEYWQVINEGSELLADTHECHEISRKCLESGNKVFFEKFTITRPCWKEQITYTCKSEPVNGCKYLTDQGCLLDSSSCNRYVGSICLQWLRNYQCFAEKKELRSSMKNAPVFCLGGDCHTSTIEQNHDMHNVAYLAVLDEMRKDMQVNPIRIFKGETNHCDKCIVSFINCCSSMKGWGKNLGLSRCSGEEKALALKRDKGLCHYVGTYCSKRDPIFRACLTKKSTYCCFNSKLARIFQQQGKVQLGMSFGGAESANCQGFTVEELQRIDFSKFNLEELFADLLIKAKSKMLKSFPKQMNNQMPTLQKQNNSNPSQSY